MHNNLNRKRLVANSTRICVASSALALAVTATWGMELLMPDRPVLVLMAFLWLLAVAVVSGVGAVVGRCQVSTANAFTVGMRTGMAMEPDPASRAHLQLVE